MPSRRDFIKTSAVAAAAMATTGVLSSCDVLGEVSPAHGGVALGLGSQTAGLKLFGTGNVDGTMTNAELDTFTSDLRALGLGSVRVNMGAGLLVGATHALNNLERLLQYFAANGTSPMETNLPVRLGITGTTNAFSSYVEFLDRQADVEHGGRLLRDLLNQYVVYEGGVAKPCVQWIRLFNEADLMEGYETQDQRKQLYNLAAWFGGSNGLRSPGDGTSYGGYYTACSLSGVNDLGKADFAAGLIATDLVQSGVVNYFEWHNYKSRQYWRMTPAGGPVGHYGWIAHSYLTTHVEQDALRRLWGLPTDFAFGQSEVNVVGPAGGSGSFEDEDMASAARIELLKEVWADRYTVHGVPFAQRGGNPAIEFKRGDQTGDSVLTATQEAQVGTDHVDPWIPEPPHVGCRDSPRDGFNVRFEFMLNKNEAGGLVIDHTPPQGTRVPFAVAHVNETHVDMNLDPGIHTFHFRQCNRSRPLPAYSADTNIEVTI